MKFIKNILFLSLAVTCLKNASAQTEYVSVEKDGTKIIRGFITRQQLETDTAFKWYAENKKGYTPYASALKVAQTNKDSVQFLVFGGTWCSDTRFILPKFFTLVDAAGFSPNRVTMIGVDRSKKTVHNLSEAFNVLNVPTIIVLKNGREVGRVVEYGTSGMFDKDLGEILTNKK